MKFVYKTGPNHVISIDLDAETSLEHFSIDKDQCKSGQMRTLKVIANLRSSIQSPIFVICP